MEKNESNPNPLAANDAIIDRLREVGLREFENGADGLQQIVKELTVVQGIAAEAGQQELFDCLSDISTLLQSLMTDPLFIEQLPSLKDHWADVICEISNYFVFLGEEDTGQLRQRVNYRLGQLAKAMAALSPAPSVDTTSDGSWGLFEEAAEAATPALSQKPAPHDDTASTSAPPAAPVPLALAALTPAPAPSAQAESPPESHLASHYLICLLGSQQYALPIHQVREILEQRQEKPLPSERPGIRGLVTVRGMVCPVVDVSHVLHAKDEILASDRKKRCMVVCEVDRRTFCFNVDDVKQVAAIEEFDDQITPLNPDNSIQKAISHVSHFQNKSVLFVKMREVIPA